MNQIGLESPRTDLFRPYRQPELLPREVEEERLAPVLA